MYAPTYRLVIIGAHDEVLDTITLDGYDLNSPQHRAEVGELVRSGMGTTHAVACAGLPALDDDGEPIEDDRPPYVGEGSDGCRRSAQIDLEETDSLPIGPEGDKRRFELFASAERWMRQAARTTSVAL